MITIIIVCFYIPNQLKESVHQKEEWRMNHQLLPYVQHVQSYDMGCTPKLLHYFSVEWSVVSVQSARRGMTRTNRRRYSYLSKDPLFREKQKKTQYGARD